MSMVLFLNFLTLISIGDIFFHSDLHKTDNNIIMAFMIFIGYFNYRNFIKNDKYKNIIITFDNEPTLQKVIGSILVICYMIGTWKFFFYFADMGGKIHGW